MPNDQIKLLSHEVREIISFKPSWLLRNGMTLFAIIVLGLIAVTFFVNLPNVIVVKAKLSSVPKDQTPNFIQPPTIHYYSEFYIPKNNYISIKPGQKVLLKIEGYSSTKYGVIEGKLDFISNIATDSGYYAKVILPNGLKTNQTKQVEYYEGQPVQVEITTNDVKLSHRILNSILPRSRVE